MECEERPLSFKNDRGETLSGIMCSKGRDEKECAILCHTIATDKNWNFLPTIAKELPMDTFRFDFSGHGDSQGEFDFCCYERHVADLRAVITGLRSAGKNVTLLAGHGTGANVVLLYSCQYDDIPVIINIGARYRMEKNQFALFSADEKLTCQRQGWVMWVREHREFKVTEDAVKLRTKIDMTQIKKIVKSRVLTLHGSADKEVHVEDARIIDSVIPQSTLFIIPDGDHIYSREEYVDAMMRAIIAFLAPTEAAGCCAIL